MEHLIGKFELTVTIKSYYYKQYVYRKPEKEPQLRIGKDLK